MRHIFVDRARAKGRDKRDSGQALLDISGFEVADTSQDERILLVDEVLKQLEMEDPDSARLNGDGVRSSSPRWTNPARSGIHPPPCPS